MIAHSLSFFFVLNKEDIIIHELYLILIQTGGRETCSVMIWEARFSGSHRNRNWESRTSILWLMKLSLYRINTLTSKRRYSFQWPSHSIMASVTTVKSTPLQCYSWYCWIYSITLFQFCLTPGPLLLSELTPTELELIPCLQ